MIDRHEIARRLLSLIGLPRKIAALDAEKIEHGLHSQTFQKFRRLVAYLEESKIEI